MSQNNNPYDPYVPPQSGQYIPPPPPQYSGADIPPDSPHHGNSTPRQGRGLAGWLTSGALAVWGVVKYGLVLMAKIPALGTVLSGLVAVGAYALLFPWQVAVGLVVLILIHELGHVAEIRRQGLAASAPIFIPFFGAGIFMRGHAQTPIKQAEIAIAGPIAGTVGALAAFVLFSATRNPLYLVWAYFGFWINLFNLIPFGFLDGGWILAPISKWIQLAGLAVILVLVFAVHLSPIVLLVVLFGLPMVYRRFRDRTYDQYLTSDPLPERLTITALWIALVAFLGVAFYNTEGLLQSGLR